MKYTFDVFGRDVLLEFIGTKRKAYYLGNEGKKRPADDIQVPDGLDLDDCIAFLADLCHEWARPGRNEVILISSNK